MSRLHRMLLVLLPPGRRRRDGDEIARTFAEQRAAASKREQLGLWWRESVGLIRFGLRERWAGLVGWARRDDAGGEMAIYSNWKWLVAGTTLAGAAAGLIVATLTPPRYRSEALIEAVPPRVPATYVAPSDATTTDERLATIRNQIFSRHRMETIIQDLDLYHEQRASMPMEDIVEQLRASVTITLGPASWLRLSHVGSDPKTVMRVTDRLAALFIEESTRDRKLLSQGADVFLDKRIADTRRRLVDQEKALLEARGGDRAEMQVLLIENEALRTQYKALLANREDALNKTVLERTELGDQFRLVDAAHMPARPVGPTRNEMTAWGAAMGLALGSVLSVAMVVRRRIAQPKRPMTTTLG